MAGSSSASAPSRRRAMGALPGNCATERAMAVASGADLLVLGHMPRHPLLRWLGAPRWAQRLLRQVPCDVLAVPERRAQPQRSLAGHADTVQA